MAHILLLGMLYSIAISSTLSCEFRLLTLIFVDLRVISDVVVFFVQLSQAENVVEEIHTWKIVFATNIQIHI